MRQLYWAYPGHDTGLPTVFEQVFDGVKILNSSNLDEITEKDVVLFDGGTDIDADIYNERKHPLAQKPDYMRDQMERVFFRRAQGVGAACIGVCRGAQLLCALSGGKLIQHVTGHEGPKAHVIITNDKREILASGDHHQMMYPYDVKEYEMLAWAQGLGDYHCEYGKTAEFNEEPEVVWFPQTRSLCIQPHPEWMHHMMMFPVYCREQVYHKIIRRV
jgi:GMP synthase-like glutamine amidotransferase